MPIAVSSVARTCEKAMTKNINPDIFCRECQIAGNQTTSGAYNFDCADCLARYALGSMERLSPSKEKAEAAKDALFDLLLKARKEGFQPPETA